MAVYHFLGLTQNQKSWSKTKTLSDSPFSDTGFWWTLIFFQIQDSSEKNVTGITMQQSREWTYNVKAPPRILGNFIPHLSMNLLLFTNPPKTTSKTSLHFIPFNSKPPEFQKPFQLSYILTHVRSIFLHILWFQMAKTPPATCPHTLPPWGVASNRLEVLPHQFFDHILPTKPHGAPAVSVGSLVWRIDLKNAILGSRFLYMILNIDL